MKAHFTVSVYIFDGERVLLIFHPKFSKWLPPGGHLEPNELPPDGAKREVREETGLEIEFIQDEKVWVSRWNAKSFERPALCLVGSVPAFGKEMAHQHFDLIYLAKPVGKPVSPPELTLRWFTLDEVQALKSDEEIFADTQEILAGLWKEPLIKL